MKQHTHKVLTYGAISLICVFIILASFWYKNQEELNAKKVAPQTSQQPAPLSTIQEKDVAYTIDVTYPMVLSSLRGGEEANAAMRALFVKKVSDFKSEARESYKDGPEELITQRVTSYYTISSSKEASTERYISFFVGGESYLLGSAHPSHSIDTFIFDKKVGKLVGVQDFFTASSSYLETLSRLSREDFKARSIAADADEYKVDTSDANDGFAPTQENFSRMLPLPDGLMIYFTEYQIAPYSAGPQQAVIPYSKLESVINKDGVLGEHLK